MHVARKKWLGLFLGRMLAHVAASAAKFAEVPFRAQLNLRVVVGSFSLIA